MKVIINEEKQTTRVVYKFNSFKVKDKDKLMKQINIVTNRFLTRYNPLDTIIIQSKIGYVGTDFIDSKITLVIEFKAIKNPYF